MSEIVLVHGVGAASLTPAELTDRWLDGLRTGLTAAGHADLANQLGTANGPSVEMAYYADLYAPYESLDPVALATDPQHGPAITGLALTLLQTAADRSTDEHDREVALDTLALVDEDESLWDVLRVVTDALNRLHFFNPDVVGAASWVVPVLREATLYAGDATLRGEIQDRVLTHLSADTRIVVSHSLGTVVAYETLHRREDPTVLLTAGSPLGMSPIFLENLQTQPPRTPASVTNWPNVVDPDDLIATRLDLAPFFPAAAGHTVVPVTTTVDNGLIAHDDVRYLSHAVVGQSIVAAVGRA